MSSDYLFTVNEASSDLFSVDKTDFYLHQDICRPQDGLEDLDVSVDETTKSCSNSTKAESPEDHFEASKQNFSSSSSEWSTSVEEEDSSPRQTRCRFRLGFSLSDEDVFLNSPDFGNSSPLISA